MEIPLWNRLRTMEPSLLVLLVIVVGAVGVIGLVIAITAPVGILVGDTQWKLISAFHGMSATVFLIGATIAVYLAWRLYIGEIKAFTDLKWLSAFSTAMSVVTISFGNWIYVAYRAAPPAGVNPCTGYPRSCFLATLPQVHQVFFEFKEFIALFTLPMFLVATFILWKYGDSLIPNREARAAASVPVLLGWFFLLVAYVLGAAITKLAGV
ncbi:MAG TPA: hypothetical protein VEM95_01140 [Thermoplasmata archaeon]|nr:hypothetical protein [Thermoplasmata archaeon]